MLRNIENIRRYLDIDYETPEIEGFHDFEALCLSVLSKPPM